MNVLVIGRHPEILQTVLRLLNSNRGWKASGALSDEEAIRLFSEQTFEIILIGGGVAESSERKLANEFRKQRASVRIIRHYGGGSGLLFAEIFEALKQ